MKKYLFMLFAILDGKRYRKILPAEAPEVVDNFRCFCRCSVLESVLEIETKTALESARRDKVSAAES